MKLIVCLAVLVCCVSAARSAESEPADDPDLDWDGYALVTASAAKVKTVGLAQDIFGTPDSFLLGSVVEVRLRKIEVVYGHFDRKWVDLLMTVSEPSLLSGGKQIYVLLETKGPKAKVLHWGIPEPVACLPQKLLEGKVFRRDFWLSNSEQGILCTTTTWSNQ